MGKLSFRMEIKGYVQKLSNLSDFILFAVFRFTITSNVTFHIIS